MNHNIPISNSSRERSDRLPTSTSSRHRSDHRSEDRERGTKRRWEEGEHSHPFVHYSYRKQRRVEGSSHTRPGFQRKLKSCLKTEESFEKHVRFREPDTRTKELSSERIHKGAKVFFDSDKQKDQETKKTDDGLNSSHNQPKQPIHEPEEPLDLDVIPPLHHSKKVETSLETTTNSKHSLGQTEILNEKLQKKLKQIKSLKKELQEVKKTNEFLTNYVVKSYLKNSIKFYKERKFERSIKELQELFKIQRNNAKALKLLARIFVEKNKFDKALDLLNRSIEIEENIKTFKEKTLVLMKLEKYNEALEIFKPILERDDFEKMSDQFKGDILIDKGICHFHLKQYDESIQSINQGNDLYPSIRAEEYLLKIFEELNIKE